MKDNDLNDYLKHYLRIIALVTKGKLAEANMVLNELAPTGCYSTNPIALFSVRGVSYGRTDKGYVAIKETRPSGKSKPLVSKIEKEHKQVEVLKSMWQLFESLNERDRYIIVSYGLRGQRKIFKRRKKEYNRLDKLLQRFGNKLEAIMESQAEENCYANGTF